jgi:hypothetical protein
MNEEKQYKLLNEILEWANSDETKAQSVNELAHYLFKINEVKQVREKQSDIIKGWEKWKKEKIEIIINGIK